MQPTISILIAAHGDEPHLVDSVKSALAQNYPDLTVVLSVTQQVPATVTDLAADPIVTAPSPPTTLLCKPRRASIFTFCPLVITFTNPIPWLKSAAWPKKPRRIS